MGGWQASKHRSWNLRTCPPISPHTTLPPLCRWKHGVRSALNAFPMFIKTGAVRDGEVVWRLDEPTLQAEQEAQAAVSYYLDPSLAGLGGLHICWSAGLLLHACLA